MKRFLLIAIALVLLSGGVYGCKKQSTVTVTTGEIVLCTEGEIISDTTEDIAVPEGDVADYSVTTRIETCDLHKKLADLYARAQAAIAAGQLDTAEGLLNELIALDPTYRQAGDQLAKISQGTNPGTGGGSSPGGGNTTPGGEEQPPTGPIMNLVHYVPDVLSGFVAQRLVADPFVLTREYIPAKKGSIIHLVIVAEQFKDAAGARAEVDATIKTTYPEHAQAFKVGGKEAYYGTRADVAIVTFIDGGILVAVEGAASAGDGASIESPIKSIADEIGK